MSDLRLKLLCSLFLMVSLCISCAGLQKSGIETKLIAEMEKNCTRVTVKMDYDQGVYVIAYTGQVSKDMCPIAIIRGWKGEKLIKEKEVEICGCREGKGK